MKVLVTGATGFVGNHLVDRLIKENYDVCCLVRDKEKGKILKQRKNVDIWIGDVTKPETLRGLSEGIDYVIHLNYLLELTKEELKI